MNSLDLIIVAAYMLMILFVGLWTGRHVKSVRDFNVAGKSYGLFTMIATLSSSFIGGGFSNGNAAETFQRGIGNIVALFGFSLGQWLIAKLLLPRVRDLSQCTSPGDIMHRAYGRAARILTGVCSFLFAAGVLAVQIAAVGHIFRQLLGLSYTVGIVLGFSIVLLYSTTGGIASIIAIDRIQFIVLMIGIPLLVGFGLYAVGGPVKLVTSLPPSFLHVAPTGDWLPFAGLFVSLMVGEALVPSYVQRMFVGKERHTLRKATLATAYLSVPFFIMTGTVGLLAFALDPNITASMAMPALILRVMPILLRGVVIAAMLAIVMSSADTILTSATVGLSNDVVLPLVKLKPKAQLLLTRGINVVTGCIAMAIALQGKGVFQLLLFSYQFWAPVVLAPLICALANVRVRPAVMFCAAACGIGTTLALTGSTLSVAAGFAVNAAVLAVGYIFFCRGRRSQRPTI